MIGFSPFDSYCCGRVYYVSVHNNIIITIPRAIKYYYKRTYLLPHAVLKQHCPGVSFSYICIYYCYNFKNPILTRTVKIIIY